MAIGTTLKTNLQKVYLVKFQKATEYGMADTYSEPVEYKLNVVTEPSYTDIKLFGTEANNMIKVVDGINLIKDFKIGDRIYFGKPIPNEHDDLQESNDSANYEVVSEPKGTLNIGTLRFKKLTGKWYGKYSRFR